MPTQSPMLSLQSSTEHSRESGIASMLDMLNNEPAFLRKHVQNRIQRVMHSRRNATAVFAPHVRWSNQPHSANAQTMQANSAVDASKILEQLSTFSPNGLSRV